MGNACCSSRRKKKEKREIVLLLIGLDNAGKTVAARGLAGEYMDEVVPTVGFHTVRLVLRNFVVKVYDLGGSANFRGLWPKYFVDAFGVIFVLDSSDLGRLNEAKTVLESVVSSDKIQGKPMLLLANKQDSDLALDEIDLHEMLNLESLVNAYRIPTLVECCSAHLDKSKKVDPGIQRGFTWIVDFVGKNYDSLRARVMSDLEQQQSIEKKLREGIVAKIKESKRIEHVDEDAIELYSDYARRNVDDEASAQNGRFYHGTVEKTRANRDGVERTAKDFVKDQLRMSCNGGTTTTGTKKKNRTEPVNLIDGELRRRRRRPLSAKAAHCKESADSSQRRIKSATPFIANLPNMTSICDPTSFH